MDKVIKTIIWPIWAGPIIYLAVVWNRVPEKVPLHYNLSGDPDRYGNKTEFLILFAILLVVNIGLYFLLVNMNRVDPKKKYREENLPRLRKLAFAVCIFISAITCFIIYTTIGSSPKFNSKIIVVAVGLLFTVIGNYMYNIKPNYFAGIRLPWTLENENNWKQTHLLGGKLWFAGGLLIALMAILLPENIVLIAIFVIIAILTVIPAVYSYRLYKKGPK
jgi:uncharacterized membrane protein